MIVAEEHSEARQQFLINVLQPAFPDHENLPAVTSKLQLVSSIASDVRSEFLIPELRPSCRPDTTITAGMPMPVATVDENNPAVLWKHEVRSSGKIATVKSETESHAMNDGPNDQFRFCVARSDSGHVPGTLFPIVDVSHERDPGWQSDQPHNRL